MVVDKLTKMAHFRACSTERSAEGVAQLFVDTVLKLHGLPRTVLTDEMVAFGQAVIKLIGTMHRKSTASHPQTDDKTRRMNKLLEDMLRHYVNPSRDNWNVLPPVLQFAVNDAAF